MILRGLPMETKPGYGADLLGTTAGILLQHDGQCEGGVGGVYAHLDSIKPGRLLISTERSPFPPYLWRITIAQDYYRPKNDQSNRKDRRDEHRWAVWYTKGNR
jgi:hypothetical protein